MQLTNGMGKTLSEKESFEYVLQMIAVFLKIEINVSNNKVEITERFKKSKTVFYLEGATVVQSQFNEYEE
ncbi:MAG: hypothetical protein ACRC2T_10800 [Thermoguttaceae bacterium]